MEQIKLIVFDFDGVFTNGNFYFNNTTVSKTYNCKDAYALKILKQNNIKCGIITNDEKVSIEYAPHIFDRLDKYSIGSNKLKIDILDEWIKEYDISYNNVAYMGDDLPDISILEKVGFSACPHNSNEKVKNTCRYICNNNGGSGAVREFVDLIINNSKQVYDNKFQFTTLEDGISEMCDHFIQINNNIKKLNDGKITAVIPVRKGSKRCVHKNIRNFNNTNLLTLKIQNLLMINEIDEIIVSSDCDEMLGLAQSMGVKTHKRNLYHASSECPNYEYWKYIAQNVGHCDNFMMVNCTSPLLNVVTIKNIIEKYKEQYNEIVTVTNYKKFFVDGNTNKAINFNSTTAPNSQELSTISEINFGVCICERQKIIDTQCIYGSNPIFFDLDEIEGVDIDNNSEFLISELLHKENITNSYISKLIMERKNNKVELLDCTIRDGGYLTNWNYSNEEIVDCYKAVTESGYDYFEIGFRSDKLLISDKGRWCYSEETDINAICNIYKGCEIVVMAKIGTVTLDNFVPKSQSNISMVRVLLARQSVIKGEKISIYSEESIVQACNFCVALIDLGYKVCVNFGCCDLISEEEIAIICKIFHNIDIHCLYLADTYGNSDTRNIPIHLHNFYTELNKYNSQISLGFHAHNNNSDGLSKVNTAIYHGCVMIDTCIGGRGRGAGNVITEEFLCSKYKNTDDFINKILPILEYYDKYIMNKQQYNSIPQILSHPYYNISGTLSLHPDYIHEIINNETTDVNYDINLIFALDKHTKEINYRNYDKHLIKTFNNKFC